MPCAATVPAVIVLSCTRAPYALAIVTLPPPAVFAAPKDTVDGVVCAPAALTLNVLVPSARPGEVQFVASVTWLAVSHVPVLNPVLPTAALASGLTELLNSAARTSSADRLA